MQNPSLLDEFNPDLPRPAVLCTLVHVTGSCPQAVGAKMWITPSEFFGTLGGGRFEFEILQYARNLLESRQEPHIKEYVLCKELGQCCGGRVQVFFEPKPKRRAIHLFGAGHVGRATAQVLSGTPFVTTVIDPRPEWAKREEFPRDVRLACGEPLHYAKSRPWSPDDAVCVFTHSHDLDLLLIEHFLRQPVGYLGLIGSTHKADVFKARLASGHDAKNAEALEDLWEEKVHCPIGEPISGKNPKIIGISIASELLKTWGSRETTLLEPSKTLDRP